jgi:hypothetical protein
MDQPSLPNQADADAAFDKNFKPKGAIAFFILLIILGAAIWYGIYFLMLSHI